MAYQVLVICVVSSIVLAYIVWRKESKKKLPPSPNALPIIGHLHLVSPIPPQDFHKLSLRHGPIMQLFLGSIPCVVVSTAEAAKEFLKTHEINFSNRPGQNVAVQFLTYLFGPYGPSVRQQETKKFIKRVLQKGIAGEAVDFGAEFMRLSNNIISRMTMSQTSSKDEKQAEEMRMLVADVTKLNNL